MEYGVELDDETVNSGVLSMVSLLGDDARFVSSLAFETILRPHGGQVLSRMLASGARRTRFVFFIVHSNGHWSFAWLMSDTDPATLYHIDSVDAMHEDAVLALARALVGWGGFGKTINIVYPGDLGGQDGNWECGHYVLAAARVSTAAARSGGPVGEELYFSALRNAFHDLCTQIRALGDNDGDEDAN